eukprot:943124_1
MITTQNDGKTQFMPLHRFTPQNLCDHIERWVLNDVDYQNNLSETKSKFMKRKLNGHAISTQPMVNTTLMMKNDLQSFMTPATLKIILTFCKQWNQQKVDDVKSKSEEEVADILFNYPLHKLLRRITDDQIGGERFIQYIREGKEDVIAEETGWGADEVYQIHSVLFRYHTFTKLQFTQNMNALLRNKYTILSNEITDQIKEQMKQHDVEVIHCKIKHASSIDAFSDSVMNMVDELSDHQSTMSDMVGNELTMQIYKAVAECFVFREDYNTDVAKAKTLILQLQHWICNNCGNCNMNTYINSKFTIKVHVCTLCGMDQLDQIILKLRNHDSYIMVNQTDLKGHEAESKEQEDHFIGALIAEAIDADGSFNLLCPNRNHKKPCRAILRLTKRLIKYKRWLYTINRKKGSDDIKKTVKVDVAKHIDKDTYKRTFMRSVKDMELITANQMQSITHFVQNNGDHLSANLFLNNNVNNKKTFSEMVQAHLTLPVSSCKKLYNAISKALKPISKAQDLNHDIIKRVFIEKAQFIRNQTQLLTEMFHRNADDIADITMFTNITAPAFGKLIRTNTEIDLATGVRLYRAIKEPLKQQAQTKQFGQFLSDLDIKTIQ